MIYETWGFNSSPFETTSLPSNEIGERLLIGRDLTLKSLINRISSHSKMATIEGLVGVGKTSVLNVALYKILKEFQDDQSKPLYLPCRKPFQLDPAIGNDDFIDSVYLNIAQTLIDNDEVIKLHGQYIDINPIKRLLNSPESLSLQAGVLNFQLGYQRSINTARGFERMGFRNQIDGFIRQIFPDPENGSILCVIDNLELLKTSEKARSIFEQLRDELFLARGLKWIFCGSLGIVRGLATSPRLDGFLHIPIEVGEIGQTYAKDILASRIKAYAKNVNDAYLPLVNDDFVRLYNIMRGNTRSILSYADNYCYWVSDRELPNNDSEKKALFDFG